MNRFDGTRCIGGKARRGIAFVRVEKTDEVMRRCVELLRRGRSRTNGHATVDLPRIGTDDLRIELLGKRNRQIGFA
jgi:hypothetical protein